MKFLEKNLEDILFETPNEILQSRGLCIFGRKRRQLRIGNYGTADLVTFDTETHHESVSYNDHSAAIITVYELKQSQVDKDAFWQAIRYANGIRNYMSDFRNLPLISESTYYKIVLIGSSINTRSELIYLPNITMDDFDVSLYTYSYEFDGIKFKKHADYNLIEPGFENGGAK